MGVLQVGADGASSVVRTLLEEQGIGSVRSVRLEEKRQNTRVYKTIMIPLQHTEYSGPDGSGICTLSERSAAGRVFESLPTKEGALVGYVLVHIFSDPLNGAEPTQISARCSSGARAHRFPYKHGNVGSSDNYTDVMKVGEGAADCQLWKLPFCDFVAALGRSAANHLWSPFDRVAITAMRSLRLSTVRMFCRSCHVDLIGGMVGIQRVLHSNRSAGDVQATRLG